MIMLDSSIVIEHLKAGKLQPGLISKLTLIELLRGIQEGKREAIKKELEELYAVQDIDNETILVYCRLYDHLRDSGELIPEADLLIAATAISKKIPFATRDQHFDRLIEHGLILSKD